MVYIRAGHCEYGPIKGFVLTERSQRLAKVSRKRVFPSEWLHRDNLTEKRRFVTPIGDVTGITGNTAPASLYIICIKNVNTAVFCRSSHEKGSGKT